MQKIQSVAIIGGGLGGLALAQGLKDSGIKATIFERDESPSGRSQGYVIGLNKDGISVVSSFGISNMKEFLQHNDCSGFVMADSNLNVMMQIKGASTDMALVNRWKLRELLSTGLNIEWNKKFVRYEEFEDHVDCYFEDGTIFKSDIVVGADGSKSKVRDLRCPTLNYAYTGSQNVSGYLLAPSNEELPILSKIGHKTLLRIVSPVGITMLVLPFKDDQNENNIVWSISHPCPESYNFPEEYDEMMKVVKEKASAFHPEVAKLIEKTPKENNLGAKKLFAIQEPKGKNPLGKTGRVTLLGDAAHAMTTHRGLGANTAFLDARDLAKALISENWKTALATYEAKMTERGFKAARDSLQSTNSLHVVGWKASVRDGFLKTIGYIVWMKDKLHL